MKIAFYVIEDFNLGAAYVICYLKQIGHEVKLFFEPYPNTRKRRFMGNFKADLVCFSCVTANFGWALQEAKKMKANCPTAKILFGGVHPTLCPEDITKEGFDVCIGDGIEYFGGKFNPDIFPDREIFFKQMPPVQRAYQIFMTGFGCPFKCSYCNSSQLHKKIIKRSIESCITELKLLKQRGLKYVLFVDDILTLNRSWLLSFLDDYNSHIGLPFTCFGHTNYIDTDICKQLKASNCQAVWLGIQTGNEETRKNILNRYETNEQIKKVCGIIKDNGLKLIIDHIFGLPTDTYEKILESYNFYKSLKPDVVDCNELLYFPKAEINKYGTSKTLYEKQGGYDFKRYAKSFSTLPLLVN